MSRSQILKFIVFFVFVIILLNIVQYDDSELVEKIFGTKSNITIVSAFLRDKLLEHREIPFIEDYDIKWNTINNIDLIIYEKPIVGYVKFMSSYFYFDKDGYVLMSKNEQTENVAEFVGLNINNIVLNQKLKILDESYLKSILNISDNINRFRTLPISMVNYVSLNDIRLQIYNIEVRLGDNSYMETKFSLLNDMIDSIKDKKGILFLQNCKENMIDEQYIFRIVN